MTNLEANKERIRSFMPVCMIAHICRYGEKCAQKHKSCSDCEFDEDIYKCIEEVLSEHKEPIKLKKWEYDLIRTNDCSHENLFYTFATYRNMKRVGHFSGIKDTSMTLEEILNNCEVVDD